MYLFISENLIAIQNHSIFFFLENFSLLNLLILLPIFGSIFLLFLFKYKTYLIPKISILISGLCFVVSIILFFYFNLFFNESNFDFYQFFYYYSWLPNSNINFVLGIDGISLLFIVLTTFLMFLCFTSLFKSINYMVKEIYICLFLLESFLILIFSVQDLIFFYIFFESVLIPMFFIIGCWGSRERRIRANYMFFLYTLIGSLFMLVGILFIFFETGTTNYQILLLTKISFNKQLFIWFGFFLSFATKIPMFPFHIWLPEAHVEAPTVGSVILAGILLKLGGYGFIKFSLMLLPQASHFLTPLIHILGIFSVIFASFTAIRQTDLKRIIAYSSIAHMNIVVIGIFSPTKLGLQGSVFLMLSHGFISSALFLCVGFVYNIYHTRLLKYYTGLANTKPMLATFLLFFSFSNSGLPGTSGFLAEFLIFLGISKSNFFVCFLLLITVVLSAIYSLWLLNRVIFTNTKTEYLKIYSDIKQIEYSILLVLMFNTIFFGLFTEILLNFLI